MSRRSPSIGPLPASEAESLVRFWREEGFDGSHPVEALAACTDPEEEGAWIRHALDAFGDCGRVIRSDEGLVAFAKYAPPELFGARGAGLAARIAPNAVLLAGLCVAGSLEGAGLARLLLEAVERDLHKRGLKTLEAFGCPATGHEEGAETGPTACRPVDFYERHGFKVRSRGPGPVIVRMELRSIVSWTENLEGVLDGLLAAGVVALSRRATAPTGT